MVRAVCLAGVMLAGALVGATAQETTQQALQEMTLPRISHVTVDWNAVLDELAANTRGSTPPSGNRFRALTRAPFPFCFRSISTRSPRTRPRRKPPDFVSISSSPA